MACPSETRLQAFVDGALDDVEVSDLSLHLDGCDECRIVVGAVQPVPLDDAIAVDRVGRYVLRRVLGKGGMGVVYEAVDPELHRKVALKILRADLGAGQARLLGEAKAMALLSHPHVVRIYDVGREGERVFIVMELVEGTSLRHWLAREARPLPTILDAFCQAAEGLGAAHEAGLVHRDFKPENVFVTDEGRVLVGDFGLAVAPGVDATAGEGSLAYMAQEQRHGKADARSDQYSFGVALDEAIRGTRTPGRGEAPRVPRWLAKVIDRARSTLPDERFASMRALVDALRAGRRRARRVRLSLAGVAAALALAGGGVWASGREARNIPLCRDGAAQIAAVWDASTSKQTEEAFRRTNSPLWEGAWRKTSTVLADYRDAWRAAQGRTCGARSEAPAVRAQKVSCLAESLELYRAVTSSLGHVDASMLEQVPAMLQLLPRTSACEDSREIAQLAPPPSADKAGAVDGAKRQIARAAATIVAGRYDEGLAIADDAFRAANETGYLPALAEAHLWVGTAHGRLGHVHESEQALERAASSASAGHAPVIAIRAWIQLLHFIGFEGKRYDDGHRYAEYARAALDGMPAAYELEAERLAWSRAMLVDQKRYGEALVVSRQELALVELRFGAEHRLSAAALDGLASVLAGQCKARDAIDPQQRSCAILEKEFGSPHPQVALCLGNLAALHSNLGEHDRATPLKRRALDMFERVPGHPNHVAMGRRNMVRSLLELGRFAEARTELEAAAALSKRESEQITILLLRGELQRRENDATGALESHLAAVQRTRASDPPRRLEPLVTLAETQLAAERFADAATTAAEAVGIAQTVYGAGTCRSADALRIQAEGLTASGHAADAQPVAARARDVLRDAQVDPLARARASFAVATSLPPERSDEARLLALEAQAVVLQEGRDPRLASRIGRFLDH